MEDKPLIGTDGAMYLELSATEVTGDATKTLDVQTGGTAGDESGAGFYQVTAIATTSSIFDWTPVVGDFFYDDGTLVLATGDVAMFILPEASIGAGEDSSVKSFNIGFSKDKLDVTTLKNKDQKVYRVGRADASGTIDGITVLDNNKIRSKFLDTLTVTSSGKTMLRKDNKPVFFIGFLNETGVVGETRMIVIGKIHLEGITLGAAGEGTQDFSTNFSPASGSKLQLIRIVV